MNQQKDSIFHFAFISNVLSRLPPGLAQTVEQYSRAHGFDQLLLGFLASSKAEHLLHKALHEAVCELLRHPEKVPEVRSKLLSTVTLGEKVIP